jgi:hypothetical protein
MGAWWRTKTGERKAGITPLQDRQASDFVSDVALTLFFYKPGKVLRARKGSPKAAAAKMSRRRKPKSKKPLAGELILKPTNESGILAV